MQSEKMKKSRKKLSEADSRRLFQANEVLVFTLAYLDAVVAQATETAFALDKYELRTRLEAIRSTFLLQLEKAEKKLGAIDPALAENYRKVITKNREIVNSAKNKEEKETNKDKENLSPTPPIREKENKKEKEVNPSPSFTRTRTYARARIGEIALRTPSLCTATWHPTLEEVTTWADFHIFKCKDEAEWLKWWYEQMDDVLEWRHPDTSHFINWKYTLRAWWRKELFLRKSAERDRRYEERGKKLDEIDKLRAETAKLYNEKAKQKPTIITAAQRAPNYLPYNDSQKKGFFR